MFQHVKLFLEVVAASYCDQSGLIKQIYSVEFSVEMDIVERWQMVIHMIITSGAKHRR